MPLTRNEIIDAVENGLIVIRPFDKDLVGPNSIDVRLAPRLLRVTSKHLDLKKAYEYEEVIIEDGGYCLEPGEFYLGCTKEWSFTPHHVPVLEGRSSAARYNLVIHQTAGFGDIGFAGHWTLEITVTIPTIVYPNVRIGQLSFEPVAQSDAQYKGNYVNEFSDDPTPRVGRPGNF